MRAYVAVGSNIGPEDNVPRALAMLSRRVRVVGVSTFYRTIPVGRPHDPLFWNGVVAIETDFGARRVKEAVLRPIERALGRRRTRDKDAPRPIDLDLILHGDLVEPDLGIPDRSIVEHAFVALPLHELDPDLVVPGIDVALSSIVERLGSARMERLPPLPPIPQAEA